MREQAGDRRIDGGGPRCMPLHSQLLQQVLSALHQLCALLDKCVAALRVGRMYRSRNGEHLAPLIGGEARGDERARGERRFHHQATARKARDDAIAPREIGAMRGRAEGKFAYDQPLPRDAFAQRAIALRIEDVGTGTQHRDGGSLRIQPAAVGGGVYAEREAAHDGEAGGAESARKVFRIAHALRCGIAAADHGQTGTRQQFAPAAQIQQRRRIRSLKQRLRIFAVGERENGIAFCGCPFEGGIDGGGFGIREYARRDLGGNDFRERAAAGGEDLLRHRAASGSCSGDRSGAGVRVLGFDVTQGLSTTSPSCTVRPADITSA